jgi:tRNA (cytidine/uridine-2'-O-)-methyltransferase
MLERVDPTLHIALLNPEIGPNTGNIGRLCLGIGTRLHLIHPLGFQTDEKSVRRAGLDYWHRVDVSEHDSAEAFWAWAEDRPIALFSSHGTGIYTDAKYRAGHILLFGCESVGLPRALVEERGAWRIPMSGPTRSLNLANAVAVVAYGALQQVMPALFQGVAAEEQR